MGIIFEEEFDLCVPDNQWPTCPAQRYSAVFIEFNVADYPVRAILGGTTKWDTNQSQHKLRKPSHTLKSMPLNLNWKRPCIKVDILMFCEIFFFLL